MASFEQCVKVSLTKLKANIELKQQQLDVLQAVFDGKVTIAVLPTGFGKSLLFQMLPFLMAEKFGKSKPMIVIVIAPINAIMEEQVRELRAKGIMACSLSYSGSGGTTFDAEEDMEETDCDDKVILPKEVTMKELMDGKYNIIYTHPECLFQSKAIAKMIRSKYYQEHLCGIAIDEVHMILEWGPDFRPKFQRLGELTCLHPQIAHVALTQGCDFSADPRISADRVVSEVISEIRENS